MAKNIVFIYEVGQLPALRKFLSANAQAESFDIWALGVDVELALAAEGILYRSGKDLRTIKHTRFITLVAKLGRGIFDDPSFSFFSYRGIRLGDVFINGLQNYLLLALYHLDVLTSLVETQRPTQLVVFRPQWTISKTAGVFASFEQAAPIESARIVCAKFGVELIVPEETVLRVFVRDWLQTNGFYFTRAAFGLFLWVLNRIVTLTVPKKSIRILASDYWRNMNPLLNVLKESEVVLLDRGEAFKAGFRAIWQYRVRFMHIEHFLSPRARQNVRNRSRMLAEQWRQYKERNDFLKKAEYRGHPLKALVSPALDYVVTNGSKQAVGLIEGAHTMMKRLDPDLVWVRASVSAQIHFSILCYVARSLGIPSLEAQHGIFYHGEGSFFSRIPAEYVATYGPYSSRELKPFGFADDHLFAVGSPRFDVYAKPPTLRPDPKHFTLTCIMPAVLPQSWSDTYEIVEYLRGLRAAVEHIPNVHIILKLRPGPESFPFFAAVIKRELSTVSHTIAQRESVVELFARSDAIVSIYSTTVLEALISGKPVVFAGMFGMHGELAKELMPYVHAGALRVAYSSQELREVLNTYVSDSSAGAAQVSKARAFMSEQYAFDGHASEKFANAIRRLVQEPVSEQIVL